MLLVVNGGLTRVLDSGFVGLLCNGAWTLQALIFFAIKHLFQQVSTPQ
jgi:hypothetical protein